MPPPATLIKNVSQHSSPFHHLLLLLQNCKLKLQLNQIHAHIIRTGLIHTPSITSKLVASYAQSPLTKTTSVARLIADRVHGLDTYTWNTIIRGYLDEKNPKEAISVYGQVRRKGLHVDSYTILFATKALGVIEGSDRGEGMIHGEIMKMGFLSEMIIVSSVLNMYALLDDLDSARKVFDESPERDLVMWNAVVAMYAQRKYSKEALVVSSLMVKENVRPNEVTAVSMISACSGLRALREGRQVHNYVLKNFLALDVYVHNVLIDMYCKCGCLPNAETLFWRMPVRNVISWTTMMNGLSDNNHPEKAMNFLQQMDGDNIWPDEVTILGVITMCSKLGSLKFVEWIDNYVEKNLVKDNNVRISNALMDMHSKCGNIEKACQIFDQLKGKTLVSWTTIIKGLAMHGQGAQALSRFSKMKREGFKPDNILFQTILSACSHTGLVEEGRECFRSMIEDYNMKPDLQHYGCMVDLLCRAGLARDAFQVVQDMPINPDVIIWKMLLGACRHQGNADLTNEIMNWLNKLGKKDSGAYVLLSNLHAEMGEWNNVEDLRKEMKIKGVSKQEPGCSFIEDN